MLKGSEILGRCSPKMAWAKGCSNTFFEVKTTMRGTTVCLQKPTPPSKSISFKKLRNFRETFLWFLAITHVEFIKNNKSPCRVTPQPYLPCLILTRPPSSTATTMPRSVLAVRPWQLPNVNFTQLVDDLKGGLNALNKISYKKSMIYLGLSPLPVTVANEGL